MRPIVNLFVAGLLLLYVTSCHVGNIVGVKGNGEITTQEMQISDYKELSVSSARTVIYEQKPGAASYIRIEVDENIYPLLEIKSENGRLSIKTVDHTNISPTKFTVYTNSPTLARVNIAGSTDVQLKGDLKTENFNIDIAGSGNVAADNLICQSLRTEIAGSGDITLNGEADNANCEIAGSGNTNISGMVIAKVKCQVAGSGDIYTHATESLQVSIAGSGNITYKGSPKVEQSIAGSGKIKHID